MTESHPNNRLIEAERYLRDLHKENSIFLNKAMLAVPTFILPLLFPLFAKTNSNIGKAFLVLSVACLGVSVLLILHSFFVAEKGIESFQKANEPGQYEQGIKFNALVKTENVIAFYGIFCGFLFAFLAIAVPFIIIITQGENMNYKTKQSCTQDSIVTRPAHADLKKGLTVAPSASATISSQATQSSAAKPVTNSPGTVKAK